MQHATEDLSPVKKKITATFPVEEVNAAFSSAVSTMRRQIRLNGFRPGKVPPEIIEKRFYDDVRRQVSMQLVEDRVDEMIDAGGFYVLSPLVYSGGLPERGKEFSYSMTFEVLPEFEIPDYRGMPVEQEEAVVTDADIDAVLDSMREKFAKFLSVTEDRTLENGDVAFIDWVTLDEEGTIMPDYVFENKLIPVDPAKQLSGISELLKSMIPGEVKEGPVTFPADSENEELAGRTLAVRITLHDIREKILPDMDDAFAKQCGNFDTMEQLRDKLREAVLLGREEQNRAAAQKTLVTELARHTDFPLPDGMVADAVEMYLTDFQTHMRAQGIHRPAAQETELDGLRAEVRPNAEQWARNHLLLLNAARKMGLTVSDREVSEKLRRMAEQTGRDYAAVKNTCERRNLLPKLRNEILAGKAMQEIYAAAAVTMRPPAPQETDSDAEKNAASSASAAAITTDEEQNASSATAAAITTDEEQNASAATVAAITTDEEQNASAAPQAPPAGD
ncbi:MAG: trigger factor [Desulfovibrio sp.]|jgi:trigger factor|nr:trigger factor [Desulfovibrio sp.]